MSEQRGYDAVNACLAAIVCILMGNPDESRIVEIANRVGFGELPWNPDVVREEMDAARGRNKRKPDLKVAGKVIQFPRAAGHA